MKQEKISEKHLEKKLKMKEDEIIELCVKVTLEEVRSQSDTLLRLYKEKKFEEFRKNCQVMEKLFSSLGKTLVNLDRLD